MRISKEQKQTLADKVRAWQYQTITAKCLMDTFGLSHNQAISVMRFMV